MKTITRKVFAALISLNIVLSSFYPLFFAKAVYAVEAGYCQDGWTFNGGDAGDDSNWEYTGCGQEGNNEQEYVDEQPQSQPQQSQPEQSQPGQPEPQPEENNSQPSQSEQVESQPQEQEAEQGAEEQRNEEAENVQPAETRTSYIAPEPDPGQYYTPPSSYEVSAPRVVTSDEEGGAQAPAVTTEEAKKGAQDVRIIQKMEVGGISAVLVSRCSDNEACVKQVQQTANEQLQAQYWSRVQQNFQDMETVKQQSIKGIDENQKNYLNDKAKYEAMLNTYNFYKEKALDVSFSEEWRSVYSAVADHAQSQLVSLRDAADREAKQSAAEAAAKEKERRQKLVQQEIQYASDYINSRPSYLTEAQSKKTYLDDRIRVYTERLENATSEREKTDYNIKLNTLQDHLKGTEQAYNQEQAANKDKESADLQQAKDRQAQQMKDYLDTYAAGDSDAAKDKRKAFANHFLNEYKKALADSSVSERNKEIDKAIISYLEEETKRLGPQSAAEIIAQRNNANLKNNPGAQPQAIADAKNAAQATVAKNQSNAAAARQAGSGNGGLVQTVAALPNQTADAVENAIENAIDLVQDLLGGSDDTKQSFNLIPEVLAQTAASPAAEIATTSAEVSVSKSIELVPGWNLVTIPGIPTKSLTASVLLGDIASQGGYATTVSRLQNGQWNSLVIRGDAVFGGDDFAIEPGKSYFVKALLPSVYLMVDGLDFVAPVKLNVGRGWNAVGFPFMASSYTVSLLIDKVNESAVEADSLARWESGLWDTFIKQQQEAYGENFAIESNRGYLLKIKKRGTISP